jgi:hypothetical protein
MKRVSLITSAFALAMVVAPKDARAIEFGTPASEHPHRSPQNFAFELRFSPYRVQVDEEPALKDHPDGPQTPFADSFGTSPRLYIGLELDWQTFRIPYVGTIGPGLSVGTVSMSRTSRTKTTNRESGDEYSLTIYPFTLNAVLRADGLWRDRGFPLVPFAKLGLGMALWDASTTGGTSEFQGVKGKGATWGTNTAIGLAFALDSNDQGATRNMDTAIGINNTYFYAEYYWLALNGLGQDNALYVGSNSWTMGLAFEF